MGFESQYATPIVFDIETAALDNAADYLEAVLAPANYKDAAKIEAAKTEKRAGQLARASLDPDLCRLVTIGVLDPTSDTPEVRVCRTGTLAEEADVLRWFWSKVALQGGGVRRTVTFNGINFDLLVVQRRSQYLGVPFPEINVDKYRSEHIDLMLRLNFRGAIPPHSLDFYAKRFELDVPDDPECPVAEITGADIAALVADNTDYSWNQILGHCRRDLCLTAALARKLGVLSKNGK